MPLRRTVTVATLPVVALGLLALLVGVVAVPQSATSAQAGSLSDDGVEHVVAISVDGLRPAAIRGLGPGALPGYYRMIRNGASTLNARSSVEITRTLPNHTTMVTGRPILAAGGHRVTFNEDNGKTVHKVARRYVASIFDVVHDRGGSTALFASKTKFNFLNRSWNAENSRVDAVGSNNGRDKIDTYVRDDQGSLTKKVRSRLLSKPDDFTFLHMAGPDVAGHTKGFNSPAYRTAVRRTDALLRSILRTIASKPSLKASTTVILTSDHGGQNRDHSLASDRDNYTVPFMAWGAAVAPGRDLYALNRKDRRSPGLSRPGYSAPVQPIRNGEVANLVADLLDVPAVPGSRINSRRDLDLS